MTLGKESYLAILISKSCYKRLLNESGRQGLTSYNSFVIQHNFYNPEKADTWLTKRRQHAA